MLGRCCLFLPQWRVGYFYSHPMNGVASQPAGLTARNRTTKAVYCQLHYDLPTNPRTTSTVCATSAVCT